MKLTLDVDINTVIAELKKLGYSVTKNPANKTYPRFFKSGSQVIRLDNDKDYGVWVHISPNKASALVNLRWVRDARWKELKKEKVSNYNKSINKSIEIPSSHAILNKEDTVRKGDKYFNDYLYTYQSVSECWVGRSVGDLMQTLKEQNIKHSSVVIRPVESVKINKSTQAKPTKTVSTFPLGKGETLLKQSGKYCWVATKLGYVEKYVDAGHGYKLVANNRDSGDYIATLAHTAAGYDTLKYIRSQYPNHKIVGLNRGPRKGKSYTSRCDSLWFDAYRRVKR